MSGEDVVVVLDETRARVLVERIRVNVTAALADVVEAFNGRAWVALGYKSWEDLCQRELGELPRSAITELRSQGMSTRAIAAAVGVDHSTVVRSGGADAPPASVRVTGTDGRPYPATRPAATTPVERIERLRQYAALGLTGRAIAMELDLSASAVSHIARAAGIVVGRNSVGALAARVERTRALAAEGATSDQIADELGVSAIVVRRYARREGIDIVADAMTNRRTMSSTRIVTATIDAVDGIGSMFDHIDYGDLPADEVEGWVTVLDASIRSLASLRRHLKEMTG